MSSGVEGGSHVPESITSRGRSLFERGRQRFSSERALVGAAIGAVALPASAFGISYLAGYLSYIPPSEVPAMIGVATLQVVTGAVLGGLVAAVYRSR